MVGFGFMNYEPFPVQRKGRVEKILIAYIFVNKADGEKLAKFGDHLV